MAKQTRFSNTQAVLQQLGCFQIRNQIVVLAEGMQTFSSHNLKSYLLPKVDALWFHFHLMAAKTRDFKF